jgi:cbb3-type cytochrome oxidase subunit 3
MKTENKGVEENSFLRKQAWDYFATHASQRMSVFNFYIGLSSVTATTYAATWKSDSNLQSARLLLAFLLCLFAFVFWKLDQRNKALIKNAERALMAFEANDPGQRILKVFTQEYEESEKKRAGVRGFKLLSVNSWIWSYSHCFNTVFAIFAAIGFVGIVQVLYGHVHLLRWWTALGG